MAQRKKQAKKKAPARKKRKVQPKRKVQKKVVRKKEADLLEPVRRTKIRVIGVGGGGGNIVAEISSRVRKFDFTGANTDTQALRELPKKVRSFAFGQDLTRGLGCGMDAALGEQSAKADKERIKKLLEGNDICILIASLGGGTGSGSISTFAEVSQELRNLTIGIFTMPFSFEGDRRKQLAEAALEKVKPFVNAYVVIPNESIFQVIEAKTPLKEALSAVNKRLASTLEGFIDTISLPGLINIDFADVRSILEGRGRLAYVNSAEATGVAKAQEAVQALLTNPLCEYGIGGADRILFNITGDRGLKMQEVAEISDSISKYNQRARIVFGISCSSGVRDRVRVTLFAVGCDNGEKSKLNGDELGGSAGKKPRKGAALKTKKKKRVKKTSAPRAQEPQDNKGVEVSVTGESPRVRRNALEVKKAVDEELQELEKKERAWDIPAFLRNK